MNGSWFLLCFVFCVTDLGERVRESTRVVLHTYRSANLYKLKLTCYYTQSHFLTAGMLFVHSSSYSHGTDVFAFGEEWTIGLTKPTNYFPHRTLRILKTLHVKFFPSRQAPAFLLPFSFLPGLPHHHHRPLPAPCQGRAFPKCTSGGRGAR